MNYLLDTSNLLYKGFYSYPNHPCAEVFYLLSKIKSFLQTSNNSHVYLCIDGKPKGKCIDENYKANRIKEGVSVYRHLPQVIYMLQGLHRVHIKYNPELEADEVIFSLSRLLDNPCVIVSTDNDLLQALNNKVEILRKDIIINEEYYRAEMFSKFHSVNPERLPVYRAIVGDVSDNLKPPVPRFSKEIASDLANSISYNGEAPSKETIIEYRKSREKELSEARLKSIDRLIDNYNLFKSNFEIMKLSVHTDLDYSYLKDNPLLPNFPSDILGIYRIIKVLDSISQEE